MFSDHAHSLTHIRRQIKRDICRLRAPAACWPDDGQSGRYHSTARRRPEWGHRCSQNSHELRRWVGFGYRSIYMTWMSSEYMIADWHLGASTWHECHLNMIADWHLVASGQTCHVQSHVSSIMSLVLGSRPSFQGHRVIGVGGETSWFPWKLLAPILSIAFLVSQYTADDLTVVVIKILFCWLCYDKMKLILETFVVQFNKNFTGEVSFENTVL